MQLSLTQIEDEEFSDDTDASIPGRRVPYAALVRDGGEEPHEETTTVAIDDEGRRNGWSKKEVLG